MHGNTDSRLRPEWRIVSGRGRLHLNPFKLVISLKVRPIINMLASSRAFPVASALENNHDFFFFLINPPERTHLEAIIVFFITSQGNGYTQRHCMQIDLRMTHELQNSMSCTSSVLDPRAADHLVPGRKERINNLQYFCFIHFGK